MLTREVVIRITHIIRITDITDRRSTIGPSSPFNSESVYPQPESGSVANDMMGKIQVHVFRHCIRWVNGMCISDRESAPLMVSQPLTVAYSWIRGCELVPIAQVSRSQVHHKLPGRYSFVTPTLPLKGPGQITTLSPQNKNTVQKSTHRTPKKN